MSKKMKFICIVITTMLVLAVLNTRLYIQDSKVIVMIAGTVHFEIEAQRIDKNGVYIQDKYEVKKIELK